ncbi:hypothetical protein [Proteiniclasticum sp.]|uniref:guanylate kinase n=1 Tax=Proteiniclasticum sp. TaxID=2053595 RepID=UPI002899A631|nr:hypothetical protein [Proteiniclasticum sp.]
MIYIVMGPSGSGKTLVGEYLKEKGMKELVSHTTRHPRPGEVQGVSYHFVDEVTFQQTKKVEASAYAGNWYGVSEKEVEDKTKLGDVFAVIEIHGALAFKKMYGEKVKIFYIASGPRDLRRRMAHRGDTKESIRKRMVIYRKNGEACQDRHADAVLVNKSSKRQLFCQVEYHLAATKNRKKPRTDRTLYPCRQKLFS